jgi:L-fuculose-phosphate aldolase
LRSPCIDIRCADYAASGTPDVGNNAVKALEGRAAALIANHSLMAVSPTRCCT